MDSPWGRKKVLRKRTRRTFTRGDPTGGEVALNKIIIEEQEGVIVGLEAAGAELREEVFEASEAAGRESTQGEEASARCNLLLRHATEVVEVRGRAERVAADKRFLRAIHERDESSRDDIQRLATTERNTWLEWRVNAEHTWRTQLHTLEEQLRLASVKDDAARERLEVENKSLRAQLTTLKNDNSALQSDLRMAMKTRDKASDLQFDLDRALRDQSMANIERDSAQSRLASIERSRNTDASALAEMRRAHDMELGNMRNEFRQRETGFEDALRERGERARIAEAEQARAVAAADEARQRAADMQREAEVLKKLGDAKSDELLAVLKAHTQQAANEGETAAEARREAEEAHREIAQLKQLNTAKADELLALLKTQQRGDPVLMKEMDDTRREMADLKKLNEQHAGREGDASRRELEDARREIAVLKKLNDAKSDELLTVLRLQRAPSEVPTEVVAAQTPLRADILLEPAKPTLRAHESQLATPCVAAPGGHLQGFNPIITPTPITTARPAEVPVEPQHKKDTSKKEQPPSKKGGEKRGGGGVLSSLKKKFRGTPQVDYGQLMGKVERKEDSARDGVVGKERGVWKKIVEKREKSRVGVLKAERKRMKKGVGHVHDIPEAVESSPGVVPLGSSRGSNAALERARSDYSLSSISRAGSVRQIDFTDAEHDATPAGVSPIPGSSMPGSPLPLDTPQDCEKAESNNTSPLTLPSSPRSVDTLRLSRPTSAPPMPPRSPSSVGGGSLSPKGVAATGGQTGKHHFDDSE